MAKRTFTFGEEVAPDEVPTFELMGKTLTGEPAGPFEFTCLPFINETHFLRIIKLTETSKLLASAEVMEFLRQSLPEDELKRFDALLARKDLHIEGQMLAEVFNWLVEEYSNRPTQAPSVSPVGHSPTGTTSMGAQDGNNVPTPSVSVI